MSKMRLILLAVVELGLIFAFCAIVMTAHAQPAQVVNVTKTEILIFAQSQEPQTAKMPPFAYCGTQPLKNGDKILEAICFKAKGRNIYRRVLELHEKVYLEKKWNPKNMRMLVISKNINKSFSTSGSVSSTTSENDSLSEYLGTINKSKSSNFTNSGSIVPSYSQSWTSQIFDLWFFHIEDSK